MYARPRDLQGVTRFGVSGKLWRGALVMYDHRTRSLWSQQASRAIAGPLAGRELEVVESTVTDWKSWRAANPATTVIVGPEGVPPSRWLDARYLIVGGLVGVILFVSLRRLRS